MAEMIEISSNNDTDSEEGREEVLEIESDAAEKVSAMLATYNDGK